MLQNGIRKTLEELKSTNIDTGSTLWRCGKQLPHLPIVVDRDV